MMSLNRLKPTSRAGWILVGCSVFLLVVVLTLATALTTKTITQQQAVREQQAQDVAVAASLDGFAAKLKTEEDDPPLAEVPVEKRAEVIEQKSQEIGLLPNQEPSAELLVENCLQEKVRELSAIVAANRDDIERYKDQYMQMAHEYRQYCHKTFSLNGEMDPKYVQHPMEH